MLWQVALLEILCMLNMDLLRVIHMSLSLFWGAYVAKDFENKIPALLLSNAFIFIVCTMTAKSVHNERQVGFIGTQRMTECVYKV